MLKNRLQALRKAFQKELDGYLIIDQANISTNQMNMLYFTDFLGAAALLVPIEGESILYVYGVNYEAANHEAKNCRVERVKRSKDLVKVITKDVRSQKLKKLGFDVMNVQTYEKLNETLKNTVEIKARNKYVWNLRRRKAPDELKKMRKAGELTIKGMQAACDAIKAGVREYEVAAETEYAMRIHGSAGTAFDTIIAAGPRSAYPHGGCSEKKLVNGDLVVVDIGATYQDYHSDMTRTFVVGKPSAKQERMHEIVKNAQEKSFQRIYETAKAAEVDKVARAIIDKEGYGKYFVHGLGHGIGLEVHEQPVLNPASKDVLIAGNVITDEPGVYLIGYGGVRIEDTVLVSKGGAERLTTGFYDF